LLTLIRVATRPGGKVKITKIIIITIVIIDLAGARTRGLGMAKPS